MRNAALPGFRPASEKYPPPPTRTGLIQTTRVSNLSHNDGDEKPEVLRPRIGVAHVSGATNITRAFKPPILRPSSTLANKESIEEEDVRGNVVVPAKGPPVRNVVYPSVPKKPRMQDDPISDSEMRSYSVPAPHREGDSGRQKLPLSFFAINSLCFPGSPDLPEEDTDVEAGFSQKIPVSAITIMPTLG